MNYLDQLNEPQREGVTQVNGPCMLIAGAGSGKTRVLTYRIAHLMQEHAIDPFQILALTFTNKAASEMRHRIEKMVGSDARGLMMGTFHSVFARILRAEAHALGYPSHFTIYDTDDAKTLLKTIAREMNLDENLYKPNIVYNRISSAKNRLVSWQEYLENPLYQADDSQSMRPEIGKIYRNYAMRCFKNGAMDFDDLLFNTHKLFEEHLDVLNKYQHRFLYVMVDEFQDTNLCQYLIIRKLAAVHQNICVVGDDGQSIYGFRGADISNILNFEKDYPDLKIIKLEQNYRSTQVIVEAANSVIAKNKAQLPKKIWTDNEEGNLVELIKATSDNEEGKLVAHSIYEEKMQGHLAYSDFAILYRTNYQSRSFEESLRRMNMPYKIVGGLSFYQRKEIKDLLAYIRFTLNHADETSFQRIINYPKRGIGDTTVDKIMVTAAEKNIPLWEALQQAHQFLPARASGGIEEFVNKIKRFEKIIQEKDAFEAATEIARASGILKELHEDKTVEGLSRYENVQELLNAIQEFSQDEEKEDKSLGAFLQDVSLITSVDEDKDSDPDKITLMTIHMAKGLEFKMVYIVGLEEDLFPSQMMLSSRAELEEERRLFYVALTRAEKKLFLSYAMSRYRFGRLGYSEPSRFLSDIDPKFLRQKNTFKSAPVATPSGSFAKNLVTAPAKKPQPVTAKHTPSKNFVPDAASALAEGQRVEHLSFGFGVIQTIETVGQDRKATIRFDGLGEKTLLLSFAKLKIHPS